MSLLELWRELGRDYVDEVHDGALKDAAVDAVIVMAALVVLSVETIVLFAMVPA